MLDPQDLHWAGNPLDLSRQSVYALAFFVFWVVTALSCGMTALLAMSSVEVNQAPLARD
jgi:hypothetical protein